MQATESRLVEQPAYSPMVYLDSALLFFGANFLFHQNVFRRSGNRLHFTAFLFVNAWTSLTISETFNLSVHDYHASGINNMKEDVHRAQMQERFRLKLYKPNFQQ